MHTLFSDNILSPAPVAVPSVVNPFELSFHSPASTFCSTGNSYGAASSSRASTASSSTLSDGLTDTSQTLARSPVVDGGGAFTGEHASPPMRKSHARRAGNPKILFMGSRRSGKSSIQKVIFEKLPPAETLYLNTTNKIEHATLESFITFESAEIPTNLPFTSPDFDHSAIFSTAGAVVWVLDIQDEYLHSIGQLIQTAVFLNLHYPRINLEVFIHKTDGLSEEYKYDTFRNVRQRVQDELSDVGFGYPAAAPAAAPASAADPRSVAFYQTSIFDPSIYEAMSKVVQKLLPRLPAMEGLLNKLCSACRIQKAYLFDSLSKIYLATDASPTFLKDYEACADYVDVIVDVKQIYGWERGVDGERRGSDGTASLRSATTLAESSKAIGESQITFDKTGNMYLYAREINEFLSLICIMGQGSTPDKRVLIDYNVSIVHDALGEVFRL